MIKYLELLDLIPKNCNLQIFAELHYFLGKYRNDLLKLTWNTRITFLLEYFSEAAQWLSKCDKNSEHFFHES